MNKSTIKRLGYFTLTLVLGFVIGFFVNRQLTHKRLNHLRKNINKPGQEMKMLAKRLELTEEQLKEVRPILREHLPKQLILRKEHRQEMDSLRSLMFSEIRPFLNPNQKEKLERIKHRPPPHPPRPNP